VTYPAVKCFYLTPTGRYRVELRRFVYSNRAKCPLPHGYHTASVPFGVEVTTKTPGEVPHDDPAWPTHCACGYAFQPADEWQVNHEELYTRSDGGPECDLRSAPPGAMWDASWMSDVWHGPDGKCLMVRLPNGRDWMIDGRASNCTLPKDNEHNCWVRHGSPPNIHVDKAGNTCAAGAGSIASGDYHGFLHNGWLTAG
jgi:hypothetical protein